MQIIRHPDQFPFSGCVLTIGTFDGVHLGHQAVIHNLAAQGQELGLPVAVMLFEPQPREFFQPEQALPRLTRLREKIKQFAHLPVDVLIILHFDRRLAEQSAEDFINHLLIERLRVKYLVIGDDFRFGRARRGDFRMLHAAGLQAGFAVTDTDSVLLDGERISSTLIRESLQSGRLDQAKRLLGRPYAVCGRVIHGFERGRQLGFPTANIALQRKSTPVNGVFAVTMTGITVSPIPGVANVGTRPTLVGGETALLEVHLLDFHGDLYGRHVEVQFRRKIRDERRFTDLAELQAQIRRDVMAARHFFNANNNSSSLSNGL